jgi:hypothetical protein
MPPNKEQRERLKEWLELAENMDDISGDMVKFRDDPIPLWERYLRGHVALHFHMWVEVDVVTELYTLNLCADFEVSRPGPPDVHRRRRHDTVGGTDRCGVMLWLTLRVRNRTGNTTRCLSLSVRSRRMASGCL